MIGNNIVLTELGGMIVLTVLGLMALVRIVHYLKVAVYHLKEIAVHLRMAHAKEGTRFHSVETPADHDPSDVDSRRE